MTNEEIERRWQQRANGMTLAEIEAELKALPIAPKTDDQIVGRAVLARKRIELVDAERNTPPQTDPLPPASAMVTAFIPDGAYVTSVQSRSLRGVYYHVQVDKTGRRTIMLPWLEFHSLAFGHSNTAGVNGGRWLDCNPHLVDRLPKNPAPPPAAPPR
jgi:hypothetical protein